MGHLLLLLLLLLPLQTVEAL